MYLEFGNYNSSSKEENGMARICWGCENMCLARCNGCSGCLGCDSSCKGGCIFYVK